MTADTVDALAMTEHSNLPFDSFESIRDFIRFSFSNSSSSNTQQNQSSTVLGIAQIDRDARGYTNLPRVFSLWPQLCTH